MFLSRIATTSPESPTTPGTAAHASRIATSRSFSQNRPGPARTCARSCRTSAASHHRSASSHRWCARCFPIPFRHKAPPLDLQMGDDFFLQTPHHLLIDGAKRAEEKLGRAPLLNAPFQLHHAFLGG